MSKRTLQKDKLTHTSSLMFTVLSDRTSTSIIRRFSLVQNKKPSKMTNENICYIGDLSAWEPGLGRKCDSNYHTEIKSNWGRVEF